MATYNAFYVRAVGASPITVIQAEFSVVRIDKIEQGEEFTEVLLPKNAFAPPIDRLARLSADLGTDVIWLSFQSVVDAFEFHHWRSGELLRTLVFGCYAEERTWEQAEGEPEPWERGAFFDPEMLQHSLEFAETNEEKAALERMWNEADIQPGRIEPSIDSHNAAQKVAEYYNFPGWS